MQDDVSVLTGNIATGAVEEDDLANAQSTGNNEDASIGNTIASGSLTSTVSVGADEAGTFSLDDTALGSLPSLTSKGIAVTYSIIGDTLTAPAGALTVFTLQVQSNGDYTFTLIDQLDHAGGAGENNLVIALCSAVKLTDVDNDFVN